MFRGVVAIFAFEIILFSFPQKVSFYLLFEKVDRRVFSQIIWPIAPHLIFGVCKSFVLLVS